MGTLGFAAGSLCVVVMVGITGLGIVVCLIRGFRLWHCCGWPQEVDAIREFGLGFSRGILFDGSEGPGVEDVRGKLRDDILDGFASVLDVGRHEEFNRHVQGHVVLEGLNCA